MKSIVSKAESFGTLLQSLAEAGIFRYDVGVPVGWVRLLYSRQQNFLDASTTALQVARLIKEREDLVVVTSGLYTALELNFSTGITTIVVGGTMRYRSCALGVKVDLV